MEQQTINQNNNISGVNKNTTNTPNTTNEVDITSILSSTFAISSEFAKLIYSIVFTKIVDFINYFLQQLKEQLEGIVPTEQEEQQIIDTNVTLLKAIETIIQTPEFQQRWREFAEEIAQLLKILLQRISEVTGNEFEEILNKLMDLVEKNTKAFVNGVGSGALEGVCALPPAVPFCELAIAVSTGSKLTGKTFVTFLETSSKLADAFSKVFGETAEPIVNTIQKTRDFIDYIKNLQESVTSGITQGMNKIQTTLENVNDRVSNVTSQAQSQMPNLSLEKSSQTEQQSQKSQQQPQQSQPYSNVEVPNVQTLSQPTQQQGGNKKQSKSKQNSKLKPKTKVIKIKKKKTKSKNNTKKQSNKRKEINQKTKTKTKTKKINRK